MQANIIKSIKNKLNISLIVINRDIKIMILMQLTCLWSFFVIIKQLSQQRIC